MVVARQLRSVSDEAVEGSGNGGGDRAGRQGRVLEGVWSARHQLRPAGDAGYALRHWIVHESVHGGISGNPGGRRENAMGRPRKGLRALLSFVRSTGG